MSPKPHTPMQVVSGQRATLRVSITAGGRVGTTSEMASYDLPSIGRSILDNDEAPRAVSPGNRASTGSVSITIVGTLLATADYTAVARIHHTACEASVWESATSLACRVAGGSRASMRLSVTAGLHPNP